MMPVEDNELIPQNVQTRELFLEGLTTENLRESMLDIEEPEESVEEKKLGDRQNHQEG